MDIGLSLCICFIQQSAVLGWLLTFGGQSWFALLTCRGLNSLCIPSSPPSSSLQAVNQSADSDLHASVAYGFLVSLSKPDRHMFQCCWISHPAMKSHFRLRFGPWIWLCCEARQKKAMARCVMQHLSDSLLSLIGDLNLLNSLTAFITVASTRFCLFTVPPLCTLQKHPNRSLVSFCYYRTVLRVWRIICRPPPPCTSRGGRSPTMLVFTVVWGDFASQWLHFNSGFFLGKGKKKSGVAV